MARGYLSGDGQIGPSLPPRVAGWGAVVATADTRGARDLQGRFNRSLERQQTISAQNKRDAQLIQQYVATTIMKRLKRKSVATGRLWVATTAPGNIAYTVDGFGVGMPDHLNKSQAKYWRFIEEGSKAAWKKRSFKGLPLSGVFGETIAGFRGNRPLGGPAFSRIGQGPKPFSGKYVPFGPAMQYKTGILGMVRQELEGQYAYREAWRHYSEGGAAPKRAATRAALRALGRE